MNIGHAVMPREYFTVPLNEYIYKEYFYELQFISIIINLNTYTGLLENVMSSFKGPLCRIQPPEYAPP